MSKPTDGRAAYTGAQIGRGNVAASPANSKPKFKWTERQTAQAKRKYSLLSEDCKRTAKRIADANGCQPWEVVADHLRGTNRLPKLNYKGLHDGSETRRERWHRNVVERLAVNVECNGKGKGLIFIPQKWIEEIEGRPLADVITDSICHKRGDGVKHPTAEQKHNRGIDDSYDEAPTHIRNAHYKEVAETAVFFHTSARRYTANRQLHDFMRKFYRKGDCGLDNAIARAVSFAIKAKGVRK